jgi:multidrug resistance efflux pump
MDDTLAKLRLDEAQTDLADAQKQLADASQSPNRHQYKLRQQQAAVDAMRHRHQAARFSAEHKRQLARKELLSSLEADAAEELVKELEDGVIAEQEKLRELECVTPTVAVERATLNVKAKELRRDQAQQLVKESCVRAPADGSVLRILVSPGDQLGVQSRQPAVFFCSDGPRIVRAEIEQDYADRVSVGQLATIEDNSRTGATWTARVMRVGDWYTHRRSILLDPLQFNDVRTLECILEIEPSPAPLRIGQRVRVKLGTPSAPSNP